MSTANIKLIYHMFLLDYLNDLNCAIQINVYNCIVFNFVLF